MPQPAVVSWEVNGDKVDLDLLGVTGIEWRDAKVASGWLSQPLLLQAALIDKDLGAVAALLWIALRRTDPSRSYEEVLGSLSIRALQPPPRRRAKAAADG